MEVIGKDDFDKAKKLPSVEEKPVFTSMSPEEFNTLLIKMQNPVEAQKELAVQVKHFLDRRIDDEMVKNGYLSDFTRRWVREYNDILEKIQKALYGDKSVNLHLHKVTHSQIAAKIRKSKENGTENDNKKG